MRVTLVLFTAGLAAGVPQLDLMVSLAGSFTACVLALMIPPAMDMAIMHADDNYPPLRVFLACVVVVIGLVGLVGGTGATLLEICGVKVEEFL